MKVIAIIQARMGSTRLPGKVLCEIVGRPILAHVVERTLACQSIDETVVATTTAPEDDAVVVTAERCGAHSFRGSDQDVLDRYYQAAKAFGASVIVRITADCPLLDPSEVDRLVYHYLADSQLDYAALGHTYPEGYCGEVFKMSALDSSWRHAYMPSEREHVTQYILKHPELFVISSLELSQDLSRFRLTVDEPVDLQVVRAVADALAPGNPLFGVRQAAEFLGAHPEIAALNQHIPRQAGLLRSLAEEEPSGFHELGRS